MPKAAHSRTCQSGSTFQEDNTSLTLYQVAHDEIGISAIEGNVADAPAVLLPPEPDAADQPAGPYPQGGEEDQVREEPGRRTGVSFSSAS